MLIGYSRISSASQDHASQIDALERAGCGKVFIETITGTRADRPELEKLLDFARPGDQLAVYRPRPAKPQPPRPARHHGSAGAASDWTNLPQRGHRHHEPERKIGCAHARRPGQHEVESIRARCAAGRAAAIARGRMGGRPRALNDHKLRVARALMADSELSMAEIARQVGCAPSTLYRTLTGGRGAG